MYSMYKIDQESSTSAAHYLFSLSEPSLCNIDNLSSECSVEYGNLIFRLIQAFHMYLVK